MNKKRRRFAGGLLLTLCLCAAGCGNKKINLNDYVEIEIEGYETGGTADYEIDIDQLIEDNLETFGLDEDSSLMAAASVYDSLSGKLKGDLDKKDQLSNGDTVTFKWKEFNGDSLKKKYSVVFQYSDITVEVAGLDTPEEFNPFDYVQVTYTGMAPNGRIVITQDTSSPVSGILFSADKTDGLRNGDKVVVTAQGTGNLKDYCLRKGFLPTEEKKEYVVEGLTAYAMTLDEIPEETKDKMIKQAEDTMSANSVGWNESFSIKQIDLLGYYFLTPKDGFFTWNNNILYCVFKVTTNAGGYLENGSKDEKTVGEEVYYTYECYTDIMLMPDGTCSVDLSKGSIPNKSVNSQYGYSSWSYFTHYVYNHAYAELDSMFSDCVASQVESYNYESTVQQ